MGVEGVASPVSSSFIAVLGPTEVGVSVFEGCGFDVHIYTPITYGGMKCFYVYFCIDAHTWEK